MDQIIAKPNQWEIFNSSLRLEVIRPSGTFTCSAVAIDDRILLTAAHCLDGTIKKISAFNFPENQLFEIENFEIYPKYDKKVSHYLHDIAFINLKTALPSNIQTYPIYTDHNFIGDYYRLGFGERNHNNNRTIANPNFRYFNERDQVVELNDQFSKSGDSGGPIFIMKDKSIYLLAIHSTFSTGPQGEFSYNPLVSKYRDWINSKTRKNTHDQGHLSH